MAYEKVVAVFDTAARAENAVKALKAVGFNDDDISIVDNETLDDRGAAVATEKGFWHRLFGSDIDPHEAHVYGHTVGSGGSVLTLRAPDTLVDKAVSILHSHNPVDVNQRAASLGIIAAGTAPITAAATAASMAVVATAVKSAKDNEVIRLAVNVD